MPLSRRPEASLYRRNAAYVTGRAVRHSLDKEVEISRLPLWRRRKLRQELESKWEAEERLAADEATSVLSGLKAAADALGNSLDKLAKLKLPLLTGKVEAEQVRVAKAGGAIEAALQAVEERDFGTAGRSAEEAVRELWLIGGPMVVTLNQVLSQAAIGRDMRDKLRANVSEREAGKQELEAVRGKGNGRAALAAAARVHQLEAAGFGLAADVLGAQARPSPEVKSTSVGGEVSLRVLPPQELETFSDVGGLDEVKAQLKNTIGAILEHPDQAARYRVVHNGILFYGPPGSGKTLLGRALAGEYGLRYIRFSPASIASAYAHEAAANLERLFELAKANVPCVLFLDEIDAIAATRDDQPSADHREVATQLMNALEEYRAVPGLVIVGATNNIDRLDPGLREGRFDSKIPIPSPDRAARAEIFRVHLARRADEVEWSDIDLEELAATTDGRNSAALEFFVTVAAQTALRSDTKISHELLLLAIKERGGKDRVVLEEEVSWNDVVLLEEVSEQILEILNVFSHPELARTLGVKPPAGILLHGPPGTGKTTVAKAMATEVKASFYEHSAADLLSKWAGESEERVAKVFERARAARPAIVFIDEIDGLLRRRSADASSRFEERVVSQFLRELDGLTSQEGVLLVGATNRSDIIDPAISGRRLVPIEIALPDAVGRLRLLKVLCRDVSLAKDVDLRRLTTQTEGMSGADLKRMRDAAGMKALSRVTKDKGERPEITKADFEAALRAQRQRASLVEV